MSLRKEAPAEYKMLKGDKFFNPLLYKSGAEKDKYQTMITKYETFVETKK